MNFKAIVVIVCLVFVPLDKNGLQASPETLVNIFGQTFDVEESAPSIFSQACKMNAVKFTESFEDIIRKLPYEYNDKEINRYVNALLGWLTICKRGFGPFKKPRAALKHKYILVLQRAFNVLNKRFMRLPEKPFIQLDEQSGLMIPEIPLSVFCNIFCEFSFDHPDYFDQKGYLISSAFFETLKSELLKRENEARREQSFIEREKLASEVYAFKHRVYRFIEPFLQRYDKDFMNKPQGRLDLIVRILNNLDNIIKDTLTEMQIFNESIPSPQVVEEARKILYKNYQDDYKFFMTQIK